MSTQSLNCPDWRRPAGGEAWADEDVAAELLPPHAARMSINPVTSRYASGGRLMRVLLPELGTHLDGGGPTVVGLYHDADRLASLRRSRGCQTTPSSLAGR
jgi:hypothetical protein